MSAAAAVFITQPPPLSQKNCTRLYLASCGNEQLTHRLKAADDGRDGRVLHALVGGLAKLVNSRPDAAVVAKGSTERERERERERESVCVCVCV